MNRNTGGTGNHSDTESKEKTSYLNAMTEVHMLEALLKSAKQRAERAAEAAGY